MAGKKRPILTVLVILGVVSVFLVITMMIVLKTFAPSPDLSFSEKIGVIPIEGPITESKKITSQLVDFRKNDKVKAIILRINSPGGAVGPSQEIYREVQKTIGTKRVIASMGSVAASGGYYIAASADRIVANPGTITGSIGVLMEFVRFEALLEKIGIKLEVLKSGEFKDIGSPHRELTDRDRELLRSLIGDIQKQFVDAVAKGRNLPREKVQEIADGRVLSGTQAKDLGLVDVLGNFQDAVDLAKRMSNIRGEVTLIYPKRGRLGLIDLLLESASRAFTRLLHGTKTQALYQWNGSVDLIKESY